MKLIARSPKNAVPNDHNEDPIKTRITELYQAIHYHYDNLERLYAFAAGLKQLHKRYPAAKNNKNSLRDEKRLLWVSKNLKTQIEKLEKDLEFYIKALPV